MLNVRKRSKYKNICRECLKSCIFSRRVEECKEKSILEQKKSKRGCETFMADIKF